MCWAVPVFQEQKRHGRGSSLVTILIVPLISLEEDLYCRMKSFGIKVGRCQEIFDCEHEIIICSIGVVSSFEYQDFISFLYSRKRLVRIVIDEVHFLLQWHEFRKFDNLRILLRPNKIQVPLILLTATAPPNLVKSICQYAGANDSNLRIIREERKRDVQILGII